MEAARVGTFHEGLSLEVIGAVDPLISQVLEFIGLPAGLPLEVLP